MIHFYRIPTRSILQLSKRTLLKKIHYSRIDDNLFSFSYHYDDDSVPHSAFVQEVLEDALSDRLPYSYISDGLFLFESGLTRI